MTRYLFISAAFLGIAAYCLFTGNYLGFCSALGLAMMVALATMSPQKQGGNHDHR